MWHKFFNLFQFINNLGADYANSESNESHDKGKFYTYA
jgi:hypothetical protein